MLGYYLGERKWTLAAFKPEHVRGDFIECPPHPKTKKGDVKPLHPALQRFLSGERWEHEYLLPWEHFHAPERAKHREAQSHFSKFVRELTILAGVRPFGCNGFRKAAENAINSAQGEEAARCWANHSSVEITRAHYLSSQLARDRRLAELRPIVLAIPDLERLPTRADVLDADRPLLKLLREPAPSLAALPSLESAAG
jgi:hypothetical protein